jgi:hypothetical protein
MNVRFRRTGVRRYAVVVTAADEPPRTMDPAPAYDDDIPHDLVHYVVEAELGLANGVYGRAARGAGTFITIAELNRSLSSISARRNLSTRMRQRWFEFSESPRRRSAPALVG